MIITNTSNVNYQYTLPDQSTVPAQSVSNEVQTENLTDAVVKLKSTASAFLQEGQQALQTITLTNNSAVKLTNMTLADFMSADATHVAGSVTVNGVSQPSYDVKAGIPLPDLNPTESTVITYLILAGAITAAAKITNDAAVNYSVMDPVRGNVDFAERTNLVTIPVVQNAMAVQKEVDKTYAVKGDELNYTSVITNTGTLAQTNLVFKDAIPAGTTFVPDSVKLDYIAQPGLNPETGFAVKNLNPGESTVVEFTVTVN